MGTVTALTAAKTLELIADLNTSMAGKAAASHAAAHTSGGADPLTLAQSQITGLVADLAAKATDSALVHKGELVFNVKDYGALGDGVADDTAEITAAIAASTFGGIVYFPPGTYMVSSTIELLSGRTYQGAGRESSIIKA